MRKGRRDLNNNVGGNRRKGLTKNAGKVEGEGLA